jgi:DNA polymerase-3 subunit delta'
MDPANVSFYSDANPAGRVQFKDYFGNSAAAGALADMIERRKIPQTLLFSGPEGVGKATLARRFGSRLLGDAKGKIEQDDLSLEANASLIADREKWTADKRNEDPLVFSTHPDFLTFAPDGPLRQITIQQMRLLKERAQLKPLRGDWRVFLVDSIDRANEQAANSLLKTLEEPPPHLILILTARNAYDLLPTIRSRAVPFHFARLNEDDMRKFLSARGVDQLERRLSLAEGSPGVGVSLDLEAYDRRRAAMLALLKVAGGVEPFGAWMKHSDSIAARRTEKLESYLEVLYSLIEDVVRLANGGTNLRNQDVVREIEPLARKVSFEWLRAIVQRVDELVELARRNIQKAIALDALGVELRSIASGARVAAK